MNSNNKIMGVFGIYQEIELRHGLGLLGNQKQILLQFCSKGKKELVAQLQKISPKVQISRREVECLSLWVAGYSIRQTAEILYRSARTIEVHRNNIRSKMNINTKNQMIELIRENGLFDLYIHFAKLIVESS